MKRVLLFLEDYNEMIFVQTTLKKLGFDTEGLQNTRSFEPVLLSFNPQIIFLTSKGKNIKGAQFASRIKRKNGQPSVILIDASRSASQPEELAHPNIDDFIHSPINIRDVLRMISTYGGVDLESLLEKHDKLFGAKKPVSKSSGGRYSDTDDDSESIVVSGGSSEQEDTLVSGLSSADESTLVGHDGGDNESYSEERVSSVGQNEVGVGSSVAGGGKSYAQQASSISSLDREKRYQEIVEGLASRLDQKQTLDRGEVSSYTKKLREANLDRPTDIDKQKQKFVEVMFSAGSVLSKKSSK